MENRKQSLLETGRIALGVALCTGVMLLFYCMLDKFTLKVLWGALVGFALGIGNFLALSVVVNVASDKAEAQDVTTGRVLIQSSYPIRMLLLAVILVVLAKAEICDPVAMVIPLLFVRPVITVIELQTKKNPKEESGQ